MRSKNPLVIKLFSWIWRKRLRRIEGWSYKVVAVKGWRTALVDGRGGDRWTTTFLFFFDNWFNNPGWWGRWVDRSGGIDLTDGGEERKRREAEGEG